jgi:predicted benzoate:H+ symporter BenE
MFVLAAAVPALLVVVVGYVAGHAVAAWICAVLGVDAQRPPEVAGWVTGLALLAGVVRVLLQRWRRRRSEEGHQK